MSNETPTPESPTPVKAGSANKNQTKIIGAIVIAALVVLIVVSSLSGNTNNNTNGGTTVTTQSVPSFAEQYTAWKTTFLPLVQQTQADYTATTAALVNGDGATASTDFGKLSQDAANISANATSPDPILNTELRQFSQTIQALSTDGIGVINQTTPLSTFESDLKAYGSASTIATSQISADNNR